jgi:hypothetical protein
VYDYAGAESFRPGEVVSTNAGSPDDAFPPEDTHRPVDVSVPEGKPSRHHTPTLAGARRERLEPEPIALPNTDLIQIALDGYLISVRPSGTEPKLKLYLEYLSPPSGQREVTKDDIARVSARLHDLGCAISDVLSG